MCAKRGCALPVVYSAAALGGQVSSIICSGRTLRRLRGRLAGGDGGVLAGTRDYDGRLFQQTGHLAQHLARVRGELRDSASAKRRMGLALMGFVFFRSHLLNVDISAVVGIDLQAGGVSDTSVFGGFTGSVSPVMICSHLFEDFCHAVSERTRGLLIAALARERQREHVIFTGCHRVDGAA